MPVSAVLEGFHDGAASAAGWWSPREGRGSLRIEERRRRSRRRNDGEKDDEEETSPWVERVDITAGAD